MTVSSYSNELERIEDFIYQTKYDQALILIDTWLVDTESRKLEDEIRDHLLSLQGFCYFSLSKYKECVQVYKQLLQTYPRMVMFLINAAKALFYNGMCFSVTDDVISFHVFSSYLALFSDHSHVLCMLVSCSKLPRRDCVSILSIT